MTTRLFVLLTLLVSASAWAEAPARLQVNGFLTDNRDQPLDGPHQLRLVLYAHASEGQPLHDETLSVPVFRGLFAAEIGSTKVLDLDVFEGATDGVWLGLSVNGEAELSPRLRIATVPFAAYARRAGSAAMADEALSAEHATNAARLGDLLPSAFRRVSDPISFSDIVGVPAGLDDGDDDLFASLSCGPGETAVFDGASWTCALPFASRQCPDGSMIAGVDALGEVVCAVDKNDTYSGADFALSNQQCPAGQMIRGFDAAGHRICAPDVDTNTTYGVAAGQGIALDGTNFGLITCPQGQVLKAGANGSWACAADVDTNTTYNAGAGVSLNGNTFQLVTCAAGQVLKSTGSGWSCQADDNNTYGGSNFALSNRRCAAGELMTGISASGAPECTSANDLVKNYVNSRCRLYLGWRDSCHNCSMEATKWVSLTQDSCSSWGTDNGCGLLATMGAGTPLRVGRLNFDGDVGNDDNLFIAMKCD